MTGFRAADLDVVPAIEGKGRSGRDVGKECCREGTGRGWAEAASGDDTRGRDTVGLNGEGMVAATVMTAAQGTLEDASAVGAKRVRGLTHGGQAGGRASGASSRCFFGGVCGWWAGHKRD